MKNNNTALGLLTLGWGGLELARPLLHQVFPSADLDWVIFAILLIGLGLVLLTRTLLLSHNSQFGVFLNVRKE